MTTNNNPTIVLSADDKTGRALIDTIKSTVNGAGKYVAYVKAHNVTRDTVKDHAYALAVLAYPNDKPVQKTDGKRTRFGNAVQAAGAGLRGTFDKEESDGTTNLLTADGVKALAEKSDDDLLAMIKAEMAARQK